MGSKVIPVPLCLQECAVVAVVKGLVGLRRHSVSLGEEKILFTKQVSNPGPSSPQTIAMPTAILQTLPLCLTGS
jgi:hypothetical protein